MLKFFDPRYFVSTDIARGELPSAKEAYKTAMTLAWPAVVEMVLLSVVGAVDTMMVGRLGHAAIAAVGLTGQPRMLFVGIITALNTGTIALVSRRRGEGDRNSACRVLAQAVILNFVVGLILAFIAITQAEVLMKIVGAQSDTLQLATEYFKIVFVGFILQTIALTISAAQRGVGNTKLTMRINVIANLINVVLNYILINGKFGFPRLEVRGAAIATATGYSVAALLAIMSLFNKNGYLNLSGFTNFKFDQSFKDGMKKVGGNAILEQIGLRIGFIAYARIIASLGTVAYATHQIAQQLLTVTFTVGDGLAVAATALTGQNLGKKRPDLSLLYIRVIQRLALISSAIIFVIVVVYKAEIAMLFIDDAATIATVSNLFLLIAVAQPFQTSNVVFSGSLRGAGDTKFVANVMTSSIFILRIFGGWLLTHPLGMGLYGCWTALLADQLFRFVIFFPRVKKGKWMEIKL